MRRVLIYLSVCVAAVVFLTLADEVPAHENNGDDTVIHVTDEGFEPRSVEVVSGETVVFENSGQRAHWPASDDHPSHTKYPEFDPLKPLEPETEWSFTLDKPGEWEYHDHQNPYLKGEISVREDPGASGGDGFLAFIRTFFLTLTGRPLRSSRRRKKSRLERRRRRGGVLERTVRGGQRRLPRPG